MICAYDRLYLDKARISMGRMLDFAVHELKYNIAQLIAAIKRFKSIPNKRIILLLMHVL